MLKPVFFSVNTRSSFGILVIVMDDLILGAKLAICFVSTFCDSTTFLASSSSSSSSNDFTFSFFILIIFLKFSSSFGFSSTASSLSPSSLIKFRRSSIGELSSLLFSFESASHLPNFGFFSYFGIVQSSSPKLFSSSTSSKFK